MSENLKPLLTVKEQFDNEVKDLLSMKKKRGFMMNRYTHDFILGELKAAKEKTCTKTSEEYNLLKRYDVIFDGERERLVSRVENSDEKHLIVTTEDLWTVLNDVHQKIDHGGRDRMLCATQKYYGNITTEVINVFIKYCKECQEKKKRKYLNEVCVQKNFNECYEYRYQFDVIEMPVTASTCDFKWVLVVHNYLTKYTHLKPLQTNTPVDISMKLFDLFLDFGTPLIIQNEKYSKSVLIELKNLCSNLKLVSSVKMDRNFELLAGSIRDLLFDYLNSQSESRNNWLNSLSYIQDFKNFEYNTTSRGSAYSRTFGKDKRDISERLNIPLEIWNVLETDDELFQHSINNVLNKRRCVSQREKCKAIEMETIENNFLRDNQAMINVNQKKRKRVSSVIDMIMKNRNKIV